MTLCDLGLHPPSHRCNQGASAPSMMDGEEDKATPKETRHAPKMAAWCEGEHPPQDQSQRTMEPSGVEGKASTTTAAVTTRSAAKSVALGGLVTCVVRTIVFLSYLHTMTKYTFTD